MLRLIWKDIVAARWILLAGLPIYALNLAAMARLRPMFVMMALIFSGLMAFGSLAIEEIQGTGLLWASLPLRRAEIVMARYLSSALGALTGLSISLGVDRVMAAMRPTLGGEPGPSLAASAAAHVVLLLLLLLSAALLLPLCFKLGAGNGVMAFGAIGIGALLVLTLAGQLILWLAGVSNPLLDAGLYRGRPDTAQVQAAVEWLGRWGPALLGLCALGTGGALVISAGVSRRVFETRDISA